MSGFEVCKAIRRHSEVPILFLTARAQEIDRVVGSRSAPTTMWSSPSARARWPLECERSSNARAPTPLPLSLSLRPPLPLSRSTPSACRSFIVVTPLELTPHEYRLLSHLLAHPERVFSRQQLLEAVGAGSDAVYERNIDGHIKSVRAKLRAVAPER